MTQGAVVMLVNYKFLSDMLQGKYDAHGVNMRRIALNEHRRKIKRNKARKRRNRKYS